MLTQNSLIPTQENQTIAELSTLQNQLFMEVDDKLQAEINSQLEPFRLALSNKENSLTIVNLQDGRPVTVPVLNIIDSLGAALYSCRIAGERNKAIGQVLDCYRNQKPT